MKETTKLEWLFDELRRLEERFVDEPVAIEALEAVKFWAMEETVPEVDTVAPVSCERSERMPESEMMRQVIDCCEAEDIVEYAELLHVLVENVEDDDLFEAVVARPFLVNTYLASRKRWREGDV